jgi:hypothetical protein
VVAGREELKSTDRGGARRGRTYIAEVVDASGTRVVWKKRVRGDGERARGVMPALRLLGTACTRGSALQYTSVSVTIETARPSRIIRGRQALYIL